jgi:hypothetical protein
VYNGTGDIVSVYSRKGPGFRWYRGTL